MKQLLRRKVPLGALALAVVGLLLVTELAVRSIEDWLPVSQAGDAAEVELKWDQVVALDEAGEPTDVVFLGSSAMDAAIDPETWAAASVAYPHPYNAALLGQPFDSMRRWAGDFVLPRTDPALIVVGVTPFDVPQIDILDTSRAIVEKLFDDAMDRLEEGALSRADRRLADRSAIVRHRASFRSPMHLVRAARDRVTGEDKPKQDSLQPVKLVDGTIVARTEEVWAQHLMRDRGGVANYWGFTEPIPLGFTFDDPVEQQIFRSSQTTATQLRGFRDVADEAGADLVFVIPPTLPDAYTPFTGSQAATDAAEQHVRDVAADLGVPVLDFTEMEYPANHFADAVHLNKAGSIRFSQDLAAAVDDL